MTDVAQSGDQKDARRALANGYLRAKAQKWLSVLVAIWMVSGGFVIIEPSPHELMVFLVFLAAMLAGVGIHRGTLNLFNLLLVFIPFALIGGFQVKYNDPSRGFLFVTITMFLWFAGYVAANYVADAPRRHLKLMMNAYTVAAVIVATIGILAYLKLIPGHELFLRYGRAKATFKDPNVYGPFLILPAMYALQRVLLGTRRRAWLAGGVFLVLMLGIFVSFSRGAWGHLFGSSVLVFALIYLLEAKAAERLRMTGIGVAGAVVVVVALLGMLSIPSVSQLFETRANLVQNYDSGSTGRFARQGYAFGLALEHPLGLGPLEFAHLRVNEEPHDTYVTVLLSYGWGGGLAYWALIAMTLWRGYSTVLRPSAHRLLLIPLVATYLPLVIESAIIDTDHWRHFFLITGLIWGVTAAYGNPVGGRNGRQDALI